MSTLATLTLVDLIVLLVVVGAVIGALRRRAGLLATLGSALGALLVAWLVTVAVATWAPRPMAQAADGSRLLHTFPTPRHAIAQAAHLVGRLAGGDQPAPGPTRANRP